MHLVSRKAARWLKSCSGAASLNAPAQPRRSPSPRLARHGRHDGDRADNGGGRETTVICR
jgi:hypothetical protein